MQMHRFCVVAITIALSPANAWAQQEEGRDSPQIIFNRFPTSPTPKPNPAPTPTPPPETPQTSPAPDGVRGRTTITFSRHGSTSERTEPRITPPAVPTSRPSTDGVRGKPKITFSRRGSPTPEAAEPEAIRPAVPTGQARPKTTDVFKPD